MLSLKKIVYVMPLVALGVLFLVWETEWITTGLKSALFQEQIKALVMGYPIVILGSYTSFMRSTDRKHLLFSGVGFIFGALLFSSNIVSVTFFASYLILSSLLIFNFRYQLFSNKPLFLVTYILLLFAGWFACLRTHNTVQTFLIAFLTYDATLAWTWLYHISQKGSRKGIDFKKLFLYFWFPGFFLRRIAISFEEFSGQLSQPTEDRTYFKGWSLLFKSLFLVVLFISTSAYASSVLGLIYFEVYKAIYLAYVYLNVGVSIFLIYGIDVRLPFDNFLLTAHPVDFWRRWNVYMRDWLKTFYFFPSVRLFKRVEIAFLVVFFFSGLFHMLPYIILGYEGFHKQLFKFWVPGLFIAGFSFFYIRYRHMFFKLNPWQKRTILSLGIVLFWVAYFNSRYIVFHLSQWLFWKSV